MGGVLSDILSSLQKVNIKTKRYVDVLYLFALALFLASSACSLTNNVFAAVTVIQTVSAVLLIVIGLMRLLTEFASNWKRALLALIVLLFGILYSLNSQDVIPMSTVAFAIIGGIGVQADMILCAGLIGNCLLIIHNLVMSGLSDSFILLNRYQYRQFFYLDGNRFLMNKMNNSSCTDLAAHYLWMMTAYFWLRGRKITWGEIFALAALNAFIYSLTGSNTSFLCGTVLIVFASVMKLWMFADKKFSLRSRIDLRKDQKPFIKVVCNACSKTFSFLTKFSFVILAAICIAGTVFYDLSNPVLNKLNNILHARLSLGHRGILEYGVHLIAHDVPNYGESVSADGFYNYFDCSYVSLLITSGILLLAFYLIVITVVQLKNKKYIYGAALLAVCAISCIEEEHLSEIYKNFFILLLFADFDVDKKINVSQDVFKTRSSRTVNWISVALCLAFAGGFACVVIPQYKAVKELDRLDGKAEAIYISVNSNLNRMVSDGTWSACIDELSTDEYGIPMSFPADYYNVTGEFWYEAISKPEHAYYYVLYDASDSSYNEFGITEFLIDDETKSLIGEGSAVIEYDLIKGEVYSVWYSDASGCRQLKDGRDAYRTGRLVSDVQPEGYSVGAAYE